MADPIAVPARYHFRDALKAVLDRATFTDADPEYKGRVEREAAAMPVMELVQSCFDQLHSAADRIARGDLTMRHSPFSVTVADQRRAAVRHLDALRAATSAAEVTIQENDRAFRALAEYTAAQKLTR